MDPREPRRVQRRTQFQARWDGGLRPDFWERVSPELASEGAELEHVETGTLEKMLGERAQ